MQPYSEASSTTLARDKVVPSRNSIPCGRVFAARSHDVSYFSSSLNLTVILAQLCKAKNLSSLHILIHLKLLLCSFQVYQKRLKYTYNMKFGIHLFIALFKAELKRALVTQRRS